MIPNVLQKTPMHQQDAIADFRSFLLVRTYYLP